MVAALVAVVGAARAQGRTRVTCYTAYDPDYFYFAANVEKPNLAGSDRIPFGDPTRDDAIAVFLQAEDQPGAAPTARTAHSTEMAVSAAGGAQLYRGADGAPLKGFADFLTGPRGERMPFKYATTIRGQLNREGGDNTGYTVEMAIPWAELGGPPKPGERCRFNVLSYSAGAGSSPLLSLSPAVKTAEDVQNPSHWDELVFTEAPVKSVASAPTAKVSARLYNVKPLIDGQISDGEWNTLTAFGFGETAGATGAVQPSAAVSRVRPKIELRKPRPPIVPPAESAASDGAALAPHSAQPVPRLLFTLYNYDFQNDPRKAAPLRATRAADGASLLPYHPMDGSGPWLTYDRVDWHRGQLAAIRHAGIDVILPVFRADTVSKQGYALRGLQTLAAALNAMARAGQDYPLVGLYLDTTSLAGAGGAKPDLTTDAGKARLYAAIKDFYLEVPPVYRATVPLGAKNRGRIASKAAIVVLSSAAPFAALDGAFIPYCRARFEADFGGDLLLLGASDFKGKAPLDGYVNNTEGRGFQMDDAGWIKPASVGAGLDRTVGARAGAATLTAADALRLRSDGKSYRADWRQALARHPDWVFIDGWNDYFDGSEIAPTLQDGVEYADMTSLFSREFRGVAPFHAVFVADTLPRVAPTGAAYTASVRVENGGVTGWAPATMALSLQWKKDGAGVGAAQVVPLPGALMAGEAATVPFTTAIPAGPGAYTLAATITPINKKGEPVPPPAGAASGEVLEAPVRVVASGDAVLPAYGVTVIGTDLPKTVEAGGAYFTTVTLRNDGAKSWKRGAGAKVVGRLWRYVSPVNGTGEAEAFAPVEMADASADLPYDVAPGQQVTVTVPVTFSEADGAPVPVWSQADNWVYGMRWEYSANDGGTEGGVSRPETLAVTEADLGPEFTLDTTPAQLPGERRVPIRMKLRNRGPQTWLRNQARIGYHWYYLDGTEAVWQDELTPIPQDVEPGQETPEILAWVTAPPNDGTYWLVWDVKVGDSWASTLPSVRANETEVRQVEVVRGRLAFCDLTKSYNLDGVSYAYDRADGDFDGAGHTLPAELIPPFATVPVAPSTVWLPVAGSGLDSSRRISFHWGPKADKEKNLLQCLGQKVPLVEPKKADQRHAVHLLAAGTRPVSADFVLLFSDGSQQLTTVPMSAWDGKPLHNEEVAYVARYLRTRDGEQLGKAASLYHYVVRIPDNKKPIALVLPNAPEVRIAAITLEK